MYYKLFTKSFWTVIILFNINLFAQQGLDLNCGRFQLDVGDNGDLEFLYPADFEDTDHSRTDGGISFMSAKWTDRNSIFHENAWETSLYAYSSKKYLRYAPTKIVVDGIDVTESMNVYTSVDENLICDQIIEQTFISSMGLRIISTTYGFSDPLYQDFAITNYKIINTGEADEFEGVDLPNQKLDDLYFVFDRWRSWPDQHLSDIHHPGTSSHYMDYYGDEIDDSLKIFYGWDGDDPDNGNYDDEGNPAFGSTWEFLTPYYNGIGLIHADNSIVNRSNDPNKVNSVLRGANYELTNWSGDQFYTYLTTHGNFPSAINPDIPGISPKQQQQPRMYMSIGPYDMEFGDTLNLVIFYGVGARSTEECREWGTKYKNGEITSQQKNEFLRWGRLDLFNKLSRAKQLWENKLNVSKGLNPVPPASISAVSGPGYVELNWEPVANAVGYNLYRAIGVQDSVIYPLIQEKLIETSYRDEDVNRGFDYYYNITAVDVNGTESSQYWARTSRKSAVPRTALGDDNLSEVRVVPNPFSYDKSGKGNYPGQKDKILFAGLPGPCRITIFTVSGDIVDVIEHDTTEGIEEWKQISQYNQYIASGIYIFHVESKEGKGSTIGKFVIIR
ncbi:MAG: hypothetical protein KJ571_10995 [Bacteroidetes bacterium]|nr:hypothetical protein [Bacteroidota bacterium]